MKRGMCPVCKSTRWHQTKQVPTVRTKIDEDGEEYLVDATETVPKQETCKKHSPPTATIAKTKNWRSDGPRHRNRKSSTGVRTFKKPAKPEKKGGRKKNG